MMRRRTDAEIQAFLEGAGRTAEAPADWSAEDRARLAAYKLVYEALAEDPGYALPLGFAERVAAGVHRLPKRFPWFEVVLIPAAITAATAVYVIPSVPAWIQAVQAPDSGARAILEAIQAGRPDLVVGIGLVLVLLAIADRVLRKVAPTPRTA